MINSVYNYYAAQYGHREYSKYDTHSKAQLKSTFGRLQKINSQTPSYKIDFSDAALKYAIDLKENARELSQIADELSDESTDSITYKRSATSLSIATPVYISLMSCCFFMYSIPKSNAILP